jgi:hypothetical protein
LSVLKSLIKLWEFICLCLAMEARFLLETVPPLAAPDYTCHEEAGSFE